MSAAVVFLAIATPVLGIVVSDNPVLHEVTAPSDFDMVGKVSSAGGTSGVLIDQLYVLTAAHAVKNNLNSDAAITFTLGASVYNVDNDNSAMHAEADLAVLRLTASTGLPGYGLYDASTYGSEVGQEGVMAGFGVSGIGAPDPGTYPKGTNRYGYNEIDETVTDGETGLEYLTADFDDPSDVEYDGLGADKEVMFADKDSGGPTFLDDGSGNLLIAGIHVALDDVDENEVFGNYGDIGYDVRVDAYRAWIGEQIPEPATLGLLAAGAVFGLQRRRRRA